MVDLHRIKETISGVEDNFQCKKKKTAKETESQQKMEKK